jgi:RNA polymerase sigma factor (sigma-70 family)
VINKGPSEVTTPGSGVSEIEGPEFKTFDDYFRADYRLVVSFLMMIGARLEEAEDAAQEAMAEVARRWATIKHPKAYARLASKRMFLRKRVDDERSLGFRGGARLPLDSDLAVDTAVLADWVTTLTELDAILTAVQALPPVQREIVAMYMSGFEPKAIAAELKRRPSTVRSNLRHGLRELRKLLTEVPEGANGKGK